MAAAAAAASYDDELRGRAALREAFGDSSDSDPDAAREEDPCPVGRARWRWEAVAGVRGLWLCAAFLSADEQSHLLAAIQREGWFTDAHNQAMRFSDLPPWAVELSALVWEAICVGDVNVDAGPDSSEENEDSCPLPSDLLWREPLFDQLIANRYKPGQESTAYNMLKHGESEFTNVPVYLNPGSLVVMSGDARYHWKHEINRKPGAQIWNGRELEQHRRTSVTLRKLRASPN